MDISATKRCNLNCDYCSACAEPGYDSSKELSLEEFKVIFKEINDLNVHRISLAGGEPFVREDFIDILAEATKYRFSTIITNMLMNNEIKLKFKIVPPNESQVFWLFYFPLKHYGKLELLTLWKQSVNKDIDIRQVSCTAGVKACSIDENGDIYGCDLMMGMDNFIAGSLRQNSLSEIWNNSALFNKLRKINFSDIKGKCSDCECAWCGAGCRSAAYNMSGDLFGSDESCFYNKEVNI